MLDKFKKIRGSIQEARSDDGSPVEVEAAPESSADALIDRGALMGIAELVRPDGVDDRNEDFLKVSGEFTRTIYMHTLPTQVDDGWLTPWYRFEHPIDVALYIQPLPRNKWLSRTRTKISHDEAALRKEIEDGVNVPNARRVARLQDSVELVQAVEQDLTKPFQVMIAATVRAKTEKQLERITEELEGRITSAATHHARFKHLEGYITTAPFAQNELADLHAVRFLHTQGVQSMFPFVNSHITHETGALIGQSLVTGAPVIVNRFLQPPYGNVQSPNSAIIGSTGSGKSYLAKLEMLRWLYQGVPVFVIDPTPGGEYRTVAEGAGGQNVRIALDSYDQINPLDFSYAVPTPRKGEDLSKLPNAMRHKIAFLTELLRVMLRAEGGGEIMDPVTAKIFTNALLECYRRYGYQAEDVRTQLGATPENMPTLGEVHAMLDRMRRASRDQLFQSKIQPLIAALENYVGEGQYAGLYDNRSTIQLGGNLFTVFSVGDVSDQQLPIIMHMVLEFLRTTLFTREQQRSSQNKLIYVDEAQRLLQYPETAYFLGWTAATCRKYGIGLTVMTQQIGSFLMNSDGSENKVGRAVIGACSLTLLLRQHTNEIEAIRQAFKLTEAELLRLRSAQAGEGLLILDQESCWFTAQYMATPAEQRLLSTTAQERAEIAAEDEGMYALPPGELPGDEEEPESYFRPLGPGR